MFFFSYVVVLVVDFVAYLEITKLSVLDVVGLGVAKPGLVSFSSPHG